jgi:hypothetical protein
MIITDSIAITPENLQYWEQVEAKDDIHKFTILSLEDADQFNYKIMTFSYDSQYVKYLMIDIFYAGKRCESDELLKTLKTK